MRVECTRSCPELVPRVLALAALGALGWAGLSGAGRALAPGRTLSKGLCRAPGEASGAAEGLRCPRAAVPEGRPGSSGAGAGLRLLRVGARRPQHISGIFSYFGLFILLNNSIQVTEFVGSRPQRVAPARLPAAN